MSIYYITVMEAASSKMVVSARLHSYCRLEDNFSLLFLVTRKYLHSLASGDLSIMASVCNLLHYISIFDFDLFGSFSYRAL